MTMLRTEVGPDDHASGPPDAPVQLVEYGDFECPYCGQAYAQVEQVRRVLETRLLFVFRHFPLSQVHRHAMDAAEAAEAAGVQGRFWDMHRLLFEHQRALEREDLVGYAEELGLDVERFTADLDGQRFRDGIRRAFLDGARSGVQGTPTFFVNGRRHDGAFDSDTLLDALTGSGPPLYGY